jgi:hypothetical protein
LGDAGLAHARVSQQHHLRLQHAVLRLLVS